MTYDDDAPEVMRVAMPIHAVPAPLMPKRRRLRRREVTDDWDPCFEAEPPPGWEP